MSSVIALPMSFGYFVRDLFRSRHLISQLSLREFRNRYLGSVLGMVWAFLHPITTIIIYWFVLQLAFGSPDVGKTPYVLWLMAGLVPFTFLSEAIGGGTTAIMDNGYLVKKVVFRVNMLPVVRLLAMIPVHLAFVALMLVLMLIYRMPFTIYSVQIFYYLFAACCLCLGISFLSSALMPFLRDTVQVISVIMQFLFWLTPVIWPINRISEAKRSVLLPFFAANPLFYIVQGYRESLLASPGVWFWQHDILTIYFWLVTAGFMLGGMLVFKRLRPHFADVV